MGITLKDLLPGLIGLGVGSVSPKAGKAGVQTLEMADAFSQRRRRQGIEDDRISREEQRFKWSTDNKEYQDSERARQAQTRGAADTAGAATVNSLSSQGIAASDAEVSSMLNAENPGQVATLEDKVIKRYEGSPISEAAAAEMANGLPKGVVQYVKVRLANGQVTTQGLRNPQYVSGVSATTAGNAAFNAVNNFTEAQWGLDTARSTLEGQATEERSDRLAEHAEDYQQGSDFPQFSKGLHENQPVPEGPAVQHSVPRYTTASQRGTVGRAEDKVAGAGLDIQKVLSMYPQVAPLIMQMMAGQIGGAAAGQGAPSKAETGSMGRAYSQQYK